MQSRPVEVTLPLGVGGPPRGSAEAPTQLDPLERLLPPEPPPQRLAFSRYRLAELAGEQLVVRRSGDLEIVTQMRLPDARNVIALVGGGFLIAARDHVHRLSGIERRTERFPRAPRLGPTTLIASTQHSEQFWLHYAGVPKLAQFDLGREPLTELLPVVEFVELPEFDGGALLGEGDGGFVYTTTFGLARIDPAGRRERLPAPEIAGRVWRLARAARRDQVWAVTPHHLYRLGARAATRGATGVEVPERMELPPHPLALASAGRDVALLSIESLRGAHARLRIDVWTQGVSESRVLRFDAALPRADAGARSFQPELALSPAGDLLAVRGFGLHVFDVRRGARVYPRP